MNEEDKRLIEIGKAVEWAREIKQGYVFYQAFAGAIPQYFYMNEYEQKELIKSYRRNNIDRSDKI